MEPTQSVRELAQFIDHTLLRANAVAEDFKKLCEEAMENSFYAVCVPPSMVTYTNRLLDKTSIKICTVIGFPFGYNVPPAKTLEAKMAVDQGADELDMVINIAALKNKEVSFVHDDISSVVRTASGRPVKVILETCYLTQEEKLLACDIALRAGAQFVKTSSGYGSAGATEDDVALLVKAAQGRMGVKASGGIRSAETARKFLALGAKRLGTGHGVAIINGRELSGAGDY